MRIKLIRIAAVALIINICSSASPAQHYEIRLEQLYKVGSKYRLSAISTQIEKATVTSGDQVLQSTENGFSVELIADVTVLQTDSKGHNTGESLTVISSKLTKEGATTPMLPQGSVVIAMVQGDDIVFKMNGKPVEAELGKALSSAVTLFTGGPDDDELFGTRIKRKVGESWGINSDAAITFLKELDAQAAKEDIKGVMTLEKVEDNQLFISGSMNVKNVLLPLPSGFKAEAGEFRAEFSGRFPIERSGGSLDQSMKASVFITAKREQGGGQPEVRMNVVYENSASYKMRGLK